MSNASNNTFHEILVTTPDGEHFFDSGETTFKQIGENIREIMRIYPVVNVSSWLYVSKGSKPGINSVPRKEWQAEFSANTTMIQKKQMIVAGVYPEIIATCFDMSLGTVSGWKYK